MSDTKSLTQNECNKNRMIYQRIFFANQTVMKKHSIEYICE